MARSFARAGLPLGSPGGLPSRDDGRLRCVPGDLAARRAAVLARVRDASGPEVVVTPVRRAMACRGRATWTALRHGAFRYGTATSSRSGPRVHRIQSVPYDSDVETSSSGDRRRATLAPICSRLLSHVCLVQPARRGMGPSCAPPAGQSTFAERLDSGVCPRRVGRRRCGTSTASFGMVVLSKVLTPGDTTRRNDNSPAGATVLSIRRPMCPPGRSLGPARTVQCLRPTMACACNSFIRCATGLVAKGETCLIINNVDHLRGHDPCRGISCCN